MTNLASHSEFMIGLFRWKNIFIIWATVLILPWIFLSVNEYDALLKELMYLALFISCFAIYGYLINDAYDLKIDAINQPNKASLRYNKNQLILGGLTFLVLGFLIPFFGLKSQWQVFTIISVLCSIQLWSYSRFFKCTPLLGNIIVSIFCAGVPFTLFFIVEDTSVHYWIWAYTFFAFLTTLLREVVKDVEDLKGDINKGCNTLPVQKGFVYTKNICLGIGILLLLVFILGHFYLDFEGLTVWIYFISLPGLMLYIIYLLFKSNSPTQFKYISKIIKGLMLCGLLFLIIQNWIQ